MTSALAGLVFPRNDRTRPPKGCRCHCGAFLVWTGPGADYNCPHCGRDYNSAGQLLAPRSQWGEETGETAQDYYQGFNNPDAAFNES